VIDWATLTPREHEKVMAALQTVSGDLLDKVRDDIDTGAENRLIDACFHIGHEVNSGIADLARRETEYINAIDGRSE
jgi:hypothetical protein